MYIFEDKNHIKHFQAEKIKNKKIKIKNKKMWKKIFGSKFPLVKKKSVRLIVPITQSLTPPLLLWRIQWLLMSLGVQRWEGKVWVAHSSPTLWDHMDYSLSGSSIHGVLQARILEWVAISFSRGSCQPRDWIQVSQVAGRFFTYWATKEVPQ